MSDSKEIIKYSYLVVMTIITIFVSIYAILISRISQDLVNVVQYKDNEIQTLKEQKDRLEGDARYCLEQEEHYYK